MATATLQPLTQTSNQVSSTLDSCFFPQVNDDVHAEFSWTKGGITVKFHLLTLVALATGLAQPAMAADEISMTVHHTAGDKSFVVPTLAGLPLNLEETMKAARVSFTVSWFPSTPGYAAMIIDGDPSSTTGNFGSPFWWVCINDYSAAAGLQTLVKGGDKVEWSLTAQGKCPKD